MEQQKGLSLCTVHLIISMVGIRAQLTLYIRCDKRIDRPKIGGVGGVWTRVGWELKIAPNPLWVS
jgi:hypothetical protein